MIQSFALLSLLTQGAWARIESTPECITVDIVSTDSPKDVYYKTSGAFVPLPEDCQGHCRLSICDESFIALVSDKADPWHFSAGTAGLWADRTLTNSSPFMWAVDALQTDSPFGVEYQPAPSGCCGPSLYPPIFEEEHHHNNVSHCATKCIARCHEELPGRCSYVEVMTDAPSVGKAVSKCRAHSGLCVATAPESCQAWKLGAQTWQRVNLKLGAQADAVRTDRCYTEANWRDQHLANFSGAFERCGPSTVCVQGQGCRDFCTTDEECDDFPMRVCSGHGPGAKCAHKDLFGRGTGNDVGAAATFFVISGLALSAGIGGGGLYVPLLMLILGFTPHEATGLSQALLTGGASSTLIYNMRQRHPSGSKPMIDYDLVMVMGPNLLIGAFLGSSLNMAAPSWFILVLLTIILSHSAWKTFQKAVSTYKRERAGDVRGMSSSDNRLSKNVIERALSKVRAVFGFHSRLCDPDAQAQRSVGAAASGSNLQSQSAPPQFAGQTEDVEAASSDGQAAKLEYSAELESNEDSSKRSQQADSAPSAQPQFPRMQISLLCFMWIISIVCIFARGGRASPGLVPYCGKAYWIFTGSTAGVLGILSLLGAWRAVAYSNEVSAGDGFQWTVQAAVKVAVFSLGAGTLAALCGIGGGMVMGPILLNLGILPQVQSATTATTLVVLSSSSALAFLVQGAAPVDYAIFLAAATACGAVIGKAVVGFLVKLYRRPSAIIFLLGGIILASVLIMTTTGTIDVVNDIRQGRGLGFKSICSTKSTD